MRPSASAIPSLWSSRSTAPADEASSCSTPRKSRIFTPAMTSAFKTGSFWSSSMWFSMRTMPVSTPCRLTRCALSPSPSGRAACHRLFLHPPWQQRPQGGQPQQWRHWRTHRVDLEKGCISTPGADKDGLLYSEHPFTGVTLKGAPLAFTREAAQLVKERRCASPSSDYVGLGRGRHAQWPHFD